MNAFKRWVFISLSIYPIPTNPYIITLTQSTTNLITNIKIYIFFEYSAIFPSSPSLYIYISHAHTAHTTHTHTHTHALFLTHTHTTYIYTIQYNTTTCMIQYIQYNMHDTIYTIHHTSHNIYNTPYIILYNI